MGQNCCSERDLAESKQQKQQQLVFENKLRKKKKVFAIGSSSREHHADFTGGSNRPQTDHDQPIMIECLEKKELKTSATQPFLLNNVNSSNSDRTSQTMRTLINYRKNDNEIIMNKLNEGKPILQEEISEENLFMNRADVRASRQFKSPREHPQKKLVDYKSKSVFRATLSPRDEKNPNMVNLEPYSFQENQKKVLSDI